MQYFIKNFRSPEIRPPEPHSYTPLLHHVSPTKNFGLKQFKTSHLRDQLDAIFKNRNEIFKNENEPRPLHRKRAALPNRFWPIFDRRQLRTGRR
jgi:hypothetical protein